MEKNDAALVPHSLIHQNAKEERKGGTDNEGTSEVYKFLIQPPPSSWMSCR